MYLLQTLCDEQPACSSSYDQDVEIIVPVCSHCFSQHLDRRLSAFRQERKLASSSGGETTWPCPREAHQSAFYPSRILTIFKKMDMARSAGMFGMWDVMGILSVRQA